MFKPGLAFVSTSRQTNFRNLVRVLIYGHVVYISSCSLVLISRYECVTTVRNFYTEDAYAVIIDEFNLI
jgi:phosphatidylglycerophosphatase A